MSDWQPKIRSTKLRRVVYHTTALGSLVAIGFVITRLVMLTFQDGRWWQAVLALASSFGVWMLSQGMLDVAET